MYDHPETIHNLIFFYAILSILPSSRYMVKYNPGAVTESSGRTIPPGRTSFMSLFWISFQRHGALLHCKYKPYFELSHNRHIKRITPGDIGIDLFIN